MVALDNVNSHVHLIHVYNTLHPKVAEYIFYVSVHGNIFSSIKQVTKIKKHSSKTMCIT